MKKVIYGNIFIYIYLKNALVQKNVLYASGIWLIKVCMPFNEDVRHCCYRKLFQLIIQRRQQKKPLNSLSLQKVGIKPPPRILVWPSQSIGVYDFIAPRKCMIVWMQVGLFNLCPFFHFRPYMVCRIISITYLNFSVCERYPLLLMLSTWLPCSICLFDGTTSFLLDIAATSTWYSDVDTNDKKLDTQYNNIRTHEPIYS